MTLRAHLIAAVAAATLAACSATPELDDQIGAEPELEMERFFVGPLTAHGIFQDRFGDLRRSFVVDAFGSWDGEVLTLEE
ncbi:MAG: DUF3833 family protein, partial [Pseudomonadota bacterium]